MNLKNITLNGRKLTQKVLWFLLYKVLEHIKSIYGRKSVRTVVTFVELEEKASWEGAGGNFLGVSNVLYLDRSFSDTGIHIYQN